MHLTKRQATYLRLIIDDFILHGEPVGSRHLIYRYKLSVSSATVRNDMHALENKGFLQKRSSSSGRIPTTSGFKYYVEKLVEDRPTTQMEHELHQIFAKRILGIHFTINEAVEQIARLTGLTLITNSQNNKELLCAIQLVPLGGQKATVIVVGSSGTVQSRLVKLTPNIQVQDLKVAVRLFQDRLLHTPLNELGTKVLLLKNILRKKIVNFELVIQEFAKQVFDFHKTTPAKIYGEKNIINRKDISRAQLLKIISLLDKKSIWDSIEGQARDDKTLKIFIDEDNTTVLSKKLSFSGRSQEVSVVGSHRLKYGNALAVFKVLEHFLQSKQNKN